MAEAKPVRTADDEASVTRSRKVAIGLNVTVMVVLAIAFVIIVNMVAQIEKIRVHRNVASFGSYGLSDRTKSMISNLGGDVTITTAYLSTETGKSRDKYLPGLQAYTDELKLAGGNKVNVQHIARDEDRARLRDALSKKYGSESGEHEKAIADFKKLKESQLDAALQFGSTLDADRSAQTDPWVISFTPVLRVMQVFQDDKKSLDTALEDVNKLTSTTSGLPKYGDAANKVKDALRPVKDHLTESQKIIGSLASLAENVRKPDNTIVKTLNEVAASLPAIIQPVEASVGAGSQDSPPDAKAALSAFASEAQKAQDALRPAAEKISKLAKENPAIESHQFWQIAMSAGGGLRINIDAGEVLGEVSRSLHGFRQQVLDAVDRNDAARISATLTGLRQRMGQLKQMVQAVQQTLTQLATNLGQVDAESSRLLETAKGGQAFAGTIKAIEELLARFDKLPELKLGKIAQELAGDNIVVVEANNQARILTFEEVWPVRETLNANPSANDERPRTFNGDGAVGAAIVALTSDHPFATVVITTFEVEPPREARQFMQPQESAIPARQITELRERLKSANFAIKDWDLAKPGPAPEPEKGTENIYVFLPPAPPTPPNPFMGGQQNSRQFGDAERKRVQDVLDAGARGIFLACFDMRPMGFFGGVNSPDYGYGKLLREQWGINVDTSHRVVQVEPIAKLGDKSDSASDRFQVSVQSYLYMVLNGFTSHPIGQPFKNSRIIANEVCPVLKEAKSPDGVNVEPILSIPATDNFESADAAEIVRIINTVKDTKSEGIIERHQTEPAPPYPVAVAASRKKNDKEGRIVVLGTGRSIEDSYVKNGIPRIGAKSFSTDAMPSTNMDLVLNSLHWARGQEKWIAAGPAVAPAIAAIAPQTMRGLQIVLWGIVPLLVFVPGALAWWARRR